MSRFGDTYENKVTGEYVTVLRGDEDGAGEPALAHLVVTPSAAPAAFAGSTPSTSGPTGARCRTRRSWRWPG